MNDSEKIRLKERLLDVIDRLHQANQLIADNDYQLAESSLRAGIGELQRLKFRLMGAGFEMKQQKEV